MGDVNIFSNGFNDINSYIYGWIMSDGCLRREGRNKTAYGIRITSNDYDVIEWMHNLMCNGNRIYRCGACFQIKYRNQEAIDFLMRHGLTEKKSLTMQFPDIPNRYVPAFIRGFFDGDGSIILRKMKYNTYGQVSFTSGSIDFLKSLKQHLAELGIESHIYPDGRQGTHSCYLRVIKRSELESLFRILYSDGDCPRLGRKYCKFVELMNARPKYNIA